MVFAAAGRVGAYSGLFAKNQLAGELYPSGRSDLFRTVFLTLAYGPSLVLLILSVDFITQSENFFVWGYVTHAVSIMDITSDPGLVNQYLGRHPSKFE